MTIDDGTTFRALLLLASDDKLRMMEARHTDPDMLRAIRFELARRVGVAGAACAAA